jgi:serine/threonine-protein kinase
VSDRRTRQTFVASFNPERIGKFEIEDRMPEGGMSFVFRARHPNAELGLRAIKVLRPEMAAYGDFKTRFLEEARIGSQFDHENVVHIYDYGDGAEEGVPPYMVMEFVDGSDLADYIVGGRTADLDEKLRIARQMARALEHIHASGVFHRDVKPQNFIRRASDGRVKLIDFGIAKQQEASITSTLTVAGATVGTPSYMAPEQTPPAGDVTPLVDVYAFGVVVFELMAGKEWTDQLPNGKNTPGSVAYRWIREQPLDLDVLRRLDPPVPEPICSLIARCTEKTPGDRFQSFTAIAAELDGIIHGFSSQTIVVQPGAHGARPPQSGSWRHGAATRVGHASPTRVELRPADSAPAGAAGRRFGVVLPAVGIVVVLLVTAVFLQDAFRSGAGDAADGAPLVTDGGPVDVDLEGVNGDFSGGTGEEATGPSDTVDDPEERVSNDDEIANTVTDPEETPEPDPGSPPPGMVRIEPPGGDAFYIDRTEVTNGMFAVFCASPERHLECARLQFDPQAGDFPVTSISIDAARAYARWAGKRLPTAAEWEIALRTSLGGTVPARIPGNIGGDPASTDAPVRAGSIAGIGPLRDMIGNVWEMTVERRDPSSETLATYAIPENATLIGRIPTADDPFYMMLGGSYLRTWDEIYLPGQDRFEFALLPEGFFRVDIGFRCVMDAE